MTRFVRLSMIVLSLGALSACVVTEDAPSSGGMSVGARACLNALAAQTGNSVMLLNERSSEAGNTIYTIGVGPAAAPWQCVSDPAGNTFNIMSLTNEGSL